MEKDKRYEVHGPDGTAMGYFLDSRLYEYRTSTCIGFLNDTGDLIDEDEFMGRIEGNHLIRSDGTIFDIKLKTY